MMKKLNRSGRPGMRDSSAGLLAVMCLIYAVSSAAVSRRFPPISSDEIIVAVSSFNFISGHGIRYSLYDDIFAPSAYAVRDLSNHISRSLYEAWAGLWSLTRNPWIARGSAIGAGWMVLVIFYALGATIRNARFGLLLSGIFLLNPYFWMASFLINEHILLLAGMGWALTLAAQDPLSRRWAHVGAGFLAGVLLMIHPNAAFFFVGLLAFVLVFHAPFSRVWLLFHVVSGWLAGALISFLAIDWPRFLMFQKTIYWEFARPPLFSHPWTPLDWIQNTARGLWNGPTYYFNADLVSGWHAALAFFWTAIALACLATGMPARPARTPQQKRWILGLLSGLGGTLFTVVLLMKRQEALYAVVLFPFVIPLAAFALTDRSRRGVRSSAVLWILMAASMASFSHFLLQYSRRCKPYSQIVQDVTRLVPDTHMKVAGPCVLWFGFPPDQFRDVGAVVISRYYTEGQWDLHAWLGGWKPDVLILDDVFRRIFLQGQEGAERLGKILGAEASPLGTVDTGSAYGLWRVYRIRWN